MLRPLLLHPYLPIIPSPPLPQRLPILVEAEACEGSLDSEGREQEGQGQAWGR